jgi:hypothetical protein
VGKRVAIHLFTVVASPDDHPTPDSNRPDWDVSQRGGFFRFRQGFTHPVIMAPIHPAELYQRRRLASKAERDQQSKPHRTTLSAPDGRLS